MIEAKGIDQAVERFRHVLQRPRDNGIKFAKHKLEIGETVTFAGLNIGGKDSYKPVQAKLDTILNMEAPKNLTELRSFLGCINQLKNFIPDLVQNIIKMRQLLKKDIPWLWNCEHQQEFINV